MDLVHLSTLDNEQKDVLISVHQFRTVVSDRVSQQRYRVPYAHSVTLQASLQDHTNQPKSSLDRILVYPKSVALD